MGQQPILLRPEDAPTFLRANRMPSPTLWQLECERARRAGKDGACPPKRGHRPPTTTRHRGATKG